MTILDLSTHPKPYITVQELADYLEIPERTIRHHIDKGALAAVRIGLRTLRITVEEARRYAALPAERQRLRVSSSLPPNSVAF